MTYKCFTVPLFHIFLRSAYDHDTSTYDCVLCKYVILDILLVIYATTRERHKLKFCRCITLNILGVEVV